MSPPSDLQSLIAASSSAQRERRPGDAAQSLQEAVRLAPTRLDLRTALVRNLIESGQLEAASRAAEELVNASPKNANSLNLLGVVQKRQGKLQQALDTFKQATKVNKRLFSPYINIGNTARLLQRYDEAIKSFRQASKLNPKDAESVRLLGRHALRCRPRRGRPGPARPRHHDGCEESRTSSTTGRRCCTSSAATTTR